MFMDFESAAAFAVWAIVGLVLVGLFLDDQIARRGLARRKAERAVEVSAPRMIPPQGGSGTAKPRGTPDGRPTPHELIDADAMRRDQLGLGPVNTFSLENFLYHSREWEERKRREDEAKPVPWFDRVIG